MKIAGSTVSAPQAKAIRGSLIQNRTVEGSGEMTDVDGGVLMEISSVINNACVTLDASLPRSWTTRMLQRDGEVRVRGFRWP